MKKYFFDFLWYLCCALCVYNIISLTQNTLEHNGKWDSTKMTLGMGVMGAEPFVTRTQALAHNGLHLEAWHGNQEVTTKQRFDLAEMSFSLVLDPDAYVFAQMHHTGDRVYSYRLSTNAHIPSAFIVAKPNGQYISVEPFDAGLVPGKRYVITIREYKEASTVSLFVNGFLLHTSRYTPVDTQASIGFRGSFNPSTIDDIRVVAKSGMVVFQDSFAYGGNIFLAIYIVLSLAGFMAWRYGTRTLIHAGHISQLTLSILQMLGIFLLCAFVLLNRSAADKYPDLNGPFSWYWTVKESSWEREGKQQKTKSLQSLGAKKGYRVVFIGSSQTRGSGAASEKETFVAIAEEILNRKYSELGSAGDEERRIEFVNAGVSGLRSAELLDVYKRVWKDMLKPDMLVINLSYNDSDQIQFAANLREFVKINGPDIKTVFILEANNPDMNTHILPNHAVMKQVAGEFRIPVVNTHEYLISQSTTGIVWWDSVHLTPYGHILVGQYLSKALDPFIREGLGKQSE